ncbi:Eukaryotic translation initiation factor 5A-1 [Saguinus oedipus]|uniref:Eukaryotic translation initiation factor 5A-1 n=1 Tax=Saguinus oedipus TaxID=9490 RepID=A0ABQ9U0A4_SAGOE|nr:Eukaryotic translation initiation factor 5A-1 [Saguinus oedipus]
MLATHHKLCTFILKNPPENSDSGTGKKEKEKKNRNSKDKENGSISSNETPPARSSELPEPSSTGDAALPFPHTQEPKEDCTA